MTTDIENYLFQQNGTHAVVAFNLSEKRLVVSVTPWTDLLSVVIADFPEAGITSMDVYADGHDDLNLPWDIIGFDSFPLSEGRWRFVLCCHCLEYVFESRWPRLTQKSSTIAERQGGI